MQVRLTLKRLRRNYPCQNMTPAHLVKEWTLDEGIDALHAVAGETRWRSGSGKHVLTTFAAPGMSSCACCSHELQRKGVTHVM